MNSSASLHQVVGGAQRATKRRAGRGNAAGRGNTSGRGTKGQKARTGKKLSAKFEGGQMPLVQRIAKKKGFRPHRKFSVFRLNLKDLPRYLTDGRLTIDQLRQAGLVSPQTKVKILGEGEVAANVAVQTHFISQSARQKIEAAGGSIEII